MQASFQVLERDDAVLIPGVVDEPGFQTVEVEFEEGVTTDDIDTDKVVLLESQDSKRLRFERCTPDDKWEERCNGWEAAGWMPIGFEMVRFYPTLEAWHASEDE